MTARTDWFVHDRFGLFIHFGIYSSAGRHEWLKKRESMTTERYQPREWPTRNSERIIWEACQPLSAATGSTCTSPPG